MLISPNPSGSPMYRRGVACSMKIIVVNGGSVINIVTKVLTGILRDADGAE